MTLLDRALLSRVCAFTLLLVIFILFAAGIVSPLWSGWSQRADQADRIAELLVRLRRTANDAPALQQELAKMGQTQHDGGALLIAANANLAGANLQSEIKRIAEANGVQIRSTQQLPSVQEDSLNRIGVRVDLQSDTPQIARILYDLKVHRPILLVTSLAIRGQERQQTPPNQQQLPLSVQLEITAFTGVQE
jgi:Tfp pilus assembly protein PilO